MKCFATIALLACVALARAEPPLPNNQYLPPGQQVQQPNNNYLPPSQSYQPPNNNYLPPQRGQQQQPGSNAYQAPPQSNYGAPAVTSAIFPKQGAGQQQGGFQAGGYGGSGSGNSGYGSNGGYGNRNEEENYGPAKYEFKYDVQDYESGNDFGHMESRDGDLAIGRYYVLLPDGRKQIVDYEADQNGYRPTITYEQTNNGFNAGGHGGNGGHGGQGGAYNNGGNGGYDNNAQSNNNKQFGGYQ